MVTLCFSSHNTESAAIDQSVHQQERGRSMSRASRILKNREQASLR